MTPRRPGWERRASYTASVESRVWTQTGSPTRSASWQQPWNHCSWASCAPRCSSAWSRPTSPIATTRGWFASSPRAARSGPPWFRGWWPTAAQTPGSDSAMVTASRLLAPSTPMVIRSLMPDSRASATRASGSSRSSRWMCVSTRPTGPVDRLSALIAGHSSQLFLDDLGVDLLEERAWLRKRPRDRQRARRPAGRAVVLVALHSVAPAALLRILSGLSLRSDHVLVAKHLVEALAAEGQERGHQDLEAVDGAERD